MKANEQTESESRVLSRPLGTFRVHLGIFEFLLCVAHMGGIELFNFTASIVSFNSNMRSKKCDLCQNPSIGGQTDRNLLKTPKTIVSTPKSQYSQFNHINSILIRLCLRVQTRNTWLRMIRNRPMINCIASIDC